MGRKIEIDNQQYDFEDMSEGAKEAVKAIDFVNARIRELENIQALLQRAKNSYGESLKVEMISDKAGFLFGDD